MDSQNQQVSAPMTAVPFLQRNFSLIISLTALWLVFGRSLFGVGGWMTLVMMFTALPFLLIYGLVVSSIVSKRHMKQGYIFSPTMQVLVIGLIVSIIIGSITMIDGGDTSDSVKSVVSVFFGVTAASSNHSILDASGAIAMITQSLSLVLVIAVFIFAFLDRKR